MLWRAYESLLSGGPEAGILVGIALADGQSSISKIGKLAATCIVFAGSWQQLMQLAEDAVIPSAAWRGAAPRVSAPLGVSRHSARRSLYSRAVARSRRRTAPRRRGY